MPYLEFFDARDLLIHDWPSISWLVCLKATITPPPTPPFSLRLPVWSAQGPQLM